MNQQLSRTPGRAVSSLVRILAVSGLAAALLAVAGGAAAPQAYAATNAGSVQLLVPPGTPNAGTALTSGGSATAFAMTPPSGAACSGDTATGGYRVQSFMVPSSVDVATLTFNASGPLPAGSGSSYRQPMFSAAGSPFVNRTTGVSTGSLVSLPTFSFAFVGTDALAFLPAGNYKIGYACTVGSAGPSQLDKYWVGQITIVASGADPAGLTWTTATTPPVTTTTATPTTATPTTVTPTTAAPTTSSAPSTSAATTSTVSGSTTSTSTASTTTSTSSATTTTTISGSGSPTTTVSSSSGGGTLVETGGTPWPKVLWGLALLVLGRFVVLLVRPVRVRSEL